jgi:hypothetical protein
MVVGSAAALLATVLLTRPSRFSRSADLNRPEPLATALERHGILDPSAQARAPSEDSPTHYPRATLRKIKILDDILTSQNDNDPRLDSEFRSLTPEDKAALRARYRTLSAEERNGRGTIVFLLGREIRSIGDVQFLAEVLLEKPCLSLANCSQDAGSASGEQAHLEGAVNISLAYPELVSLRAIEKLLTKMTSGALPSESSLREELTRVLQSATHSAVPVVARKATELLGLVGTAGTGH